MALMYQAWVCPARSCTAKMAPMRTAAEMPFCPGLGFNPGSALATQSSAGNQA